MQADEWTLHEAKNKFSAVVDKAQHGTPQLVKKRGIPAVVLISVAEYKAYLAAKKAKRASFSDYLLAMPQDDGEFEPSQVELRNPEL